jgi:hypothetical protein
MATIDDLGIVDGSKVVGGKVYWRINGQWRYMYDLVLGDAHSRASIRNERIAQLVQEQHSGGRDVVFGRSVPFNRDSPSTPAPAGLTTVEERIVDAGEAGDVDVSDHLPDAMAMVLPSAEEPNTVLRTTGSGELRWESPEPQPFVRQRRHVVVERPPEVIPIVDPRVAPRRIYATEEESDV